MCLTTGLWPSPSTAYAETARDKLKDPTLMRLIEFVPPPEHVLKARAERAREREEARMGAGGGDARGEEVVVEEEEEEEEEQKEGKEKEREEKKKKKKKKKRETHFPVVETPLPAELPTRAEAAAKEEQAGVMRRAAGHRR